MKGKTVNIYIGTLFFTIYIVCSTDTQDRRVKVRTMRNTPFEESVDTAISGCLPTLRVRGGGTLRSSSRTAQDKLRRMTAQFTCTKSEIFQEISCTLVRTIRASEFSFRRGRKVRLVARAAYPGQFCHQV